MRIYLRHLISAALFTAVLMSFLIAASRIMSPKNNTPDGGIVEPDANGILAEPEGTIDVLILGDSESYSAFNPLKLWEEQGITSYCCGTSGQRLYYTEEFLHKAFRRQKPKIVILETDVIFREYPLPEDAIHRLNAALPVLIYHNRWKNMKAEDIRMNAEYTYRNPTKGYYYSGNVDPANPEGYMKESAETAPVPLQNRIILDRIQEFCEENGAKFLLLSTPSTVNWNMKRHNAVEQLADERKLEYMDMNRMTDVIPIDWNTDTRDKGDHMNHSGAEKVTAYLGKYLSGTGLVKDHRSDPAYRSWDDAAAGFRKMLESKLQKG
ncbi:MAG: hypothetical protein LIV11_03840 [Bacillota bacterium]|nr:hypothetical protein [Bacillota bacterium]